MKRRFLAIPMILAVLLASCSSGGLDDKTSSLDKSAVEKESSTTEPAAQNLETCEATGCVWDAYTPYDETITFTKGATKPTGNPNYPEGDSLVFNDYTRYVKEKVNVEPAVAWETDANNYDQKVALSIASGDIPDFMKVNRKIYSQLVENDLIWDMTDAYEKCISPFLRGEYSSHGERLFDEIKIDGKMMGIPGTQIFGMNFSLTWIRSDWLEKVNMDIPTTMDEMQNLAQAFVDNDLAGDNNTIGMLLGNEIYKAGYNGSSLFFSYNSYPGQWIDNGGAVEYGSIKPETKLALAKLSEMYQAGLIDKEFAVRKDVDRNELVASGRVGIIYSSWRPTGAIGDNVVSDNTADWIPVPGPFNSDNNWAVPEYDSVNGILVVSKDFEHPEAIVKAMNAGYDMLRSQGEDGEAAYKNLYINAPNMSWDVIPINMQIDHRDAVAILTKDLQNALAVGDKEVMKVRGQMGNYDVILAERENPKTNGSQYTTALARTVGSEAILVDQIKEVPIAFYGKTETMSTKQANLDKLEIETFIKIIMGEKPIDEFDNFVATWKQMGGDEITAEVQIEVDKK